MNEVMAARTHKQNNRRPWTWRGDPTPAQIELRKRQVQEEGFFNEDDVFRFPWSEKTRNKRAGKVFVPYTVPEIPHISDGRVLRKVLEDPEQFSNWPPLLGYHEGVEGADEID